MVSEILKQREGSMFLYLERQDNNVASSKKRHAFSIYVTEADKAPEGFMEVKLDELAEECCVTDEKFFKICINFQEFQFLF